MCVFGESLDVTNANSDEKAEKKKDDTCHYTERIYDKTTEILWAKVEETEFVLCQIPEGKC